MVQYLSPIIAHSRTLAEKEAFRLIAYSSAVLPDLEGKVGEVVVADILQSGVSFAVNARRCIENSNANPTITARRWDYKLEKGIQVEENLKRALNGIIHARQLRIHTVRAPTGVFENHSNGLVLHFTYETDRYPETYVDIFGMCWAFVSTPQPESVH